MPIINDLFPCGNTIPESPIVSVVITTFNYESYVIEAIRSIKSQTANNLECIIVDDGSTDNTKSVVADEIKTDRRFYYLFQENQGVASARNNGISLSRAPFIVCLDADDRLAPDYIAVCAQALEADRSLGIAYTGLMLHGDGGEPIPSAWPPEFDWQIMTTVSVPPSNCIPSAAMFRRAMWERAGGYRQVYAPAEDTEFWVRGLSVGFNARKVSVDGLFIYRVHPGSASRTKEYKAIDMWHPWMRDKQFPMAAPGVKKPAVISYSQPVISVVIPVGPGHEDYLPGAIDSILGQTFRYWEVIVVDDTRDTKLESVMKLYPFAKVYQNKGNPGAGAARNVGIKNARAPLLLLLDADDYLDPKALEVMLAAFMDGGGRYIYTDWIAIQDNSAPALMRCAEYDPGLWLATLKDQATGIHGITILMATEDARAHPFDESLIGWEETEWFLRMATRGIQGRRLPEPMLYYRVETGTRRRISLANQDDLNQKIKSRYQAYLKGERIMANCCGGSASTALLAAKRMLNGMMPETTTDYNAGDFAGATIVRMEFIGTEQGAVWYHGVEGSGRKYQGAANPLHRFANVDPADVEKLLLTNKWKAVSRQVATAVAKINAEVEPADSAPSADDLRAQAESALMAARQAFANTEQDPALEPLVANVAAAARADEIAGVEDRIVARGDTPKEKPRVSGTTKTPGKRKIVRYDTDQPAAE